ncbi:MAG: hypothetical protein ACJA0I_001783 [Gammaproteobacteria bacterium]|jgi:hypothetical protein
MTDIKINLADNLLVQLNLLAQVALRQLNPSTHSLDFEES